MNQTENQQKLIEYFSSLNLYIPNLFNEKGIEHIKKIQGYPELCAQEYINSIQTIENYTEKIAKINQLHIFNNNFPIIKPNPLVNNFEPHIQQCTNSLYRTYENWTLDKVTVMITGKSLPLECTVTSLNNRRKQTEVFYIKENNILLSQRPFGILLLEYQSNIEREYQFLLTENYIIESAIKGIQIPTSHLIYDTEQMQEGLIEMALTSMTIGLDDLEIFDPYYKESAKNYVVNPKTAIHTPIDLEYLGVNLPATIFKNHDVISSKVSLSEKSYISFVQDIYNSNKHYTEQKKERIENLLNNIKFLSLYNLDNRYYEKYKNYILNHYFTKLIYKL